MQDLISRARTDFENVLEVLREDLNTIKTGRAKPAFIEKVMVEAYEGQAKMQLLEVASITSPDPRQLIVKPWDQSILEKVEKALAGGDLNLSPVVDGDMVRIKIPPLTEERRRDLVKLVNQKLESGRVLLRQARQRVKEEIDKRKGEHDVSEDDVRDGVEELNKVTDEYVKQVDQMGEAKEKELMTV